MLLRSIWRAALVALLTTAAAGEHPPSEFALPDSLTWPAVACTERRIPSVAIDGVTGSDAVCIHEVLLEADQVSAVVTLVDSPNDGVTHRRLMVIRPEFLVIVDLLDAVDGASHRYDWVYHNRGKGITSAAAQTRGDPPVGRGYRFLRDVRSGRTNGPIRATVSLDSGNVEVVVDGVEGTGLLLATGIGESGEDRVPMMVVTREGPSARFAAVIEPRTGFVPGDVEEVAIARHRAAGWVVRVGFCCGTEEVYAYDSAARVRTIKGVRTDRKLLILRKEGGDRHRKLAESD